VSVLSIIHCDEVRDGFRHYTVRNSV
jgi:hypothetical protein